MSVRPERVQTGQVSGSFSVRVTFVLLRRLQEGAAFPGSPWAVPRATLSGVTVAVAASPSACRAHTPAGREPVSPAWQSRVPAG